MSFWIAISPGYCRDSIDEGANNFIRTANKLISRFKEDLKAQIKSMRPQRVQHLEAVTDILDEYLRSVTAVHSKQRAIRMEKELEIQKLSRLEIDARKNAREVPSASQNESQANKLQRLLEGGTSEEEFADQGYCVPHTHRLLRTGFIFEQHLCVF